MVMQRRGLGAFSGQSTDPAPNLCTRPCPICATKTAPSCLTVRMSPSAPVAAATIWPKFQGDVVPATVVAGCGHHAFWP